MPARYADFHVVQAVPASLLNRSEDDTPKTQVFGNTIRAMVSSQCWKRAIRTDLEAELGEYAARTRMVPLRVADALRTAGWPTDLATFAGAQVARSATRKGLSTDPEQDGLTLAMLFLRRDAIDDLAALCQSHRPALEEAAARQATQHTTPPQASKQRRKKESEDPAGALPTREVAALIKQRTASISLFGRMLAEVPGAHVDGAVQMAPAFTVHKSNRQPDYLTAVDDWLDAEEAGSAHLQTGFFTTGVLYRYATVNYTELLANLGGDHTQARHLLALFAEFFIFSLPQAKKTATAPHTLPHLVHYVVRDRRPISYAAAFEQPIQAAHTGGYTQPTLQALSDHAAGITRLTGTRRRIAHGHTTINDKPIDHLGTHHSSFDDLIDACTTAAANPTTSTPEPVTA